MKLSFCAIVKNEAKNLVRCLASVRPHVDELIVVDTGSTDDTVAIAQQYGAKLYHFEWCNDFAAARNYAISLVTGDWILTLDADEALVPLAEDWTVQIENGASENALAFAIKLRDAVAQDTEMQTIRLFKNKPEMRYQDAYHEYLTCAGQAFSLDCAWVKPLKNIEIIHYGYADDIIAEKSVLRIPMLEQLRSNNGLSLMLLWTLSGMYQATGALNQADDCYAEAWERLLPQLLMEEQPKDSRAVRSWLYALAVRSLKNEDTETSQFICQQGTQWFPDYPPLFYLNGLIHKLSDCLEDSIADFQTCLESHRTGHYFKGEPFDQALMTLYPAFDLGSAYLGLGQVELAITNFELTLSFDPNHTEAHKQLKQARLLLEKHS